MFASDKSLFTYDLIVYQGENICAEYLPEFIMIQEEYNDLVCTNTNVLLYPQI